MFILDVASLWCSNNTHEKHLILLAGIYIINMKGGVKLSEFESAVEIIRSFIVGEMEITEFMRYFYATEEIMQYLEHVIEQIETNCLPIRRRTICMKGVAQNKPFEVRSYAEQYIKEYAQSFRDLSDKWKENPPRVGEHLRRLAYQTAHGAYVIHDTVADIYYQVDPTLVRTKKYHDEYEFSLQVLPGYLAGGIAAENYVSQYIMPKYPASMKKGERKRLVKEEIKQVFLKDCKGFPRWIQMPEWPMGSDGKPMVYTGQKNFDHYSEYYFRDIINEEKQTVKQRW